ncbi:MAG: hypothetical protein ACYC7E_06585 [Armatimonadota bacterium]
MVSRSPQRLQAIWQRMMAQCYTPSDEEYPHFGRMGATVCAAWHNLAAFCAWALAARYTDNRWLIRNDLHAPFSPENCRWVTGRSYRAAVERARVYEAFGECKPLADWLADPRRRVTAYQLRIRLQRGWDFERALCEPLRPRRREPRRYSLSTIPIGARFGRITVIGPCTRKVYRVGSYAYLYECRCACGVVKTISGSNLLTGDISSCGCYQREVTAQRHRIHQAKQKGSPDYRIYQRWGEMIAICTQPKHARYQDYGGQGITVCTEWVRDFANFRDWARRQGFTGAEYINRHDLQQAFSPDNCFWAPRPQRVPPRAWKFYTAFGETKSLEEWSSDARCGVTKKVLESRLYRGHRLEDALTIPSGAMRKRSMTKTVRSRNPQHL